MDATHDQSHGMNAPRRTSRDIVASSEPRTKSANPKIDEFSAARLRRGRPDERETRVSGWFIGLCHYRESDYDFGTYPGNGQFSRRTTIVPKGRGAFTRPNDFVDGAVDALRLERFVGAEDWRIARSCTGSSQPMGTAVKSSAVVEYQRCEDG
jgi:hypothetical protein